MAYAILYRIRMDCEHDQRQTTLLLLIKLPWATSKGILDCSREKYNIIRNFEIWYIFTPHICIAFCLFSFAPSLCIFEVHVTKNVHNKNQRSRTGERERARERGHNTDSWMARENEFSTAFAELSHAGIFAKYPGKLLCVQKLHAIMA